MNRVRKALLTLDDAPSSLTPEILGYLQERNIDAVFFCIGAQIAALPDIADQIVRAGFRIGNHGYTHRGFSTLGLAECREELVRTEEEIDKVHRRTGIARRQKIFRFPYGDKGGNQKDAIQEILASLGFTAMDELAIAYPWWAEHNLDRDLDFFWTIDTMDYKLLDPASPFTAEDLLARQDEEPVQGGSLNQGYSDELVLMHDHPASAAIFPGYYARLIEGIESRGLVFTKKN